MKIDQIQEQIAEAKASLLAIDEKCTNENRVWTSDEEKEFKSLKAKIETLNSALEGAKEAEEIRKANAKQEEENRKLAGRIAGSNASSSDKKELDKIAKRYDLRSAFKSVMRGDRLEPGSLEAEMHEEAIHETRQFGTGIIGLGIPSKMLETRATVDQTNSAIQPTVVSGYVDALRENSIAMAVGVDVIEGLTADYKIPGVGSQSVAWATAENSAAADGGAQFTSLTLNPTRITGYVDISNRILLQNGDAPLQSVMRDLGRATSEKIDAAMFATTSVTNAPTSIPATSGVLTFTEVPTWVANTTVLKDFVLAEQTLAGGKGLSGKIAYVAATNLIQDLKQSAQVASVTPGAQNAVYGQAMINGYPCFFTVAATKNGSTSGDFVMGDWSQVKLGFFGGLDIVRDPYSALLNDETRLVLHRHCDFGTVRGAAFVKATSLVG